VRTVVSTPNATWGESTRHEFDEDCRASA